MSAVSRETEKAYGRIAASLGEIKDGIQALSLDMDFVRREIDELKASKHLSAERISAKIERMTISLSNIRLVLKDLTPPRIMNTYKIQNPDFIDTTPQDMYAEIAKAAEEIQDEVDSRCAAFAAKMTELADGRDSLQCLADYAALLKDMRDEIVSRRNRIEALKERRRNSDKDSNEQKNAAILIAKIRGMVEPLSAFTDFVMESYFRKRKRIIAEIWRTTSAIEALYDEKSKEYKERIPENSEKASISSALKELSTISRRHEETHRANTLVKSGNMSALERRKTLARLNK